MAKDDVVMIESPYRNGDRARNLRYLAWCEYHSAEVLGEFPIAATTHLLEDHSCDVHGYERFGLARDAAKRILENV